MSKKLTEAQIQAQALGLGIEVAALKAVIEVECNSGATDFPLARRDGAVLEVGCVAPMSITKTENTIS